MSSALAPKWNAKLKPHVASEVLYSSREIRAAVAAVLADATGQRGAHVAFVGAGAPDYLPDNADIVGLELTCWLKPGCTDPNALRVLADRGVILYNADDLHMKVYWSAAGAVITSANLSDNGLGDGGLHEVGVRLPPGALNLRRLTRDLRATLLTEAGLLTYEREHVAYCARNGGRGLFGEGASTDRRPVRRRPRGPGFEQWYGTRFARRPWRWMAWSEEYEEIGNASEQRLSKTEASEAENFATGAAEDFSEREWTLLVELGDGIANLNWFCPDWVVKLTSRDEGYSRTAPFEAVQVHPSSHYGPPPFVLSSAVKAAFRAVLTDNGLTTPRKFAAATKGGTPPESVLEAVYALLVRG